MLLLSHLRKWLFFIGLTAILLSVMLDSSFATDETSVPEPNMLALMGIGGAVAVLMSFFRGPRS